MADAKARGFPSFVHGWGGEMLDETGSPILDEAGDPIYYDDADARSPLVRAEKDVVPKARVLNE